MKYLVLLFLLTAFSISIKLTTAQKRDTLTITGLNLNHSAVKYGNISYLVYNKKTKESPATGFYVANMMVTPIKYNGQAAIAITQKWDARDTIAHTAYTVLKSSDLSTLLHETSWMASPYSTKFNFESRSISFEGKISDSSRSKIEEGFNESFGGYHLNWHSDLFIFTTLPFKENRSFKINFYDPGFGKPQEVVYEVTGSEKLRTYSGNQIDCWVMEYKHPGNNYQRFWIDKKNKEVLKEEDLFNSRYRYKIKLEVAENNDSFY
ncbi:MAG: DUF3108 domain-containing protein [Ginsengibacter sp.]